MREINERSKPNELSTCSDGIEVKLVCTRKRCRTQRRTECISESIFLQTRQIDIAVTWV